MSGSDNKQISPIASGLRSKCPYCGSGRLYRSYLKLRDSCDYCGENLSHADPGDGPAFFVMFIVGFVILFAALIVEVSYRPPYWVHILAWLPLTILSTLILLPVAKSLLVAYQFQFKAREARHNQPPNKDADSDG